MSYEYMEIDCIIFFNMCTFKVLCNGMYVKMASRPNYICLLIVDTCLLGMRRVSLS